jgi:hypothetical protein
MSLQKSTALQNPTSGLRIVLLRAPALLVLLLLLLRLRSVFGRLLGLRAIRAFGGTLALLGLLGGGALLIQISLLLHRALARLLLRLPLLLLALLPLL